MGGLDMAGDGAKDFVGGDVGPTVSSNFKPGAGNDDAGVVQFAGSGRTDLFGGNTDTTDQEPDQGVPSSDNSGNIVDFPGKGSSDVGYKNF